MLRVTGLKTYFYTSKGIVRAVDGVDLQMSKKESVGLVGESGCGKSVTALSLMKMVPIPGRIIEGQILFKGKDLVRITEREMRHVRGKGISMVFQDPMTFLNPVMRIGDQIREAITLHQGLEKSEAKEKAIKMLERVRMPSPEKVAEYYPYQLSGGMRQRALIGMALSCNPSLMIADEPTTALDVTVQSQILDLLKSIKEKVGISLLMITHDLGIVAEICDRVYVMYAGKIVECADIYALYERPAHPYTVALLDSTMSIDQYRKVLVTIEGVVPDLTNPPPGCRFRPRCSKVGSACKAGEPHLVEIERDHMVSCWLYG